MYMKKGKPLVFNSPQHLKGVRSSPTTLFQKPTQVDTHGCEYPICAVFNTGSTVQSSPVRHSLTTLFRNFVEERKGKCQPQKPQQKFSQRTSFLNINI